MRRRPFRRRPFRRANPRSVPPALQHANALMEAGQHAQAALAFEKIARRADARRGPRAPLFHLRAGQAYVLAGDIDKAMPHLKGGLSALAAHGRLDKLHHLAQRTVDELTARGYSAEAEEIASLLPEQPPATSVTPPHAPGRLPTHCPGCGAPVRVNEVEWIDPATAECLYCGSPIQKE